MRPQVTISRLNREDPRMLAWVMVMPRHGGGGPKVSYGSGFFHWLRNQLLMVGDYAYKGADFCDDPELALPEGEVWDDQGKKRHYPLCFQFLYFISFLFFSTEVSENISVQILDPYVQQVCHPLLGEYVPGT